MTNRLIGESLNRLGVESFRRLGDVFIDESLNRWNVEFLCKSRAETKRSLSLSKGSPSWLIVDSFYYYD